MLPIAILAVYFLVCLSVGYLGTDRRMGFWGYFFFSLLFSPAIALLLVLVSEKKSKVIRDQQLAEIRSSNEKIEKFIDSQSRLYQDVGKLLTEKLPAAVKPQEPSGTLPSAKIEEVIDSNRRLREDLDRLLAENQRLHEEIAIIRTQVGTQTTKNGQPVELKQVSV